MNLNNYVCYFINMIITLDVNNLISFYTTLTNYFPYVLHIFRNAYSRRFE